MDQQQFWALIDQSRAQSRGNLEKQAEALHRLLADHEASEVSSFRTRMITVSRQLYTFEHLGAGELMCGEGGYLGDDSFTDFRTWIIAQGSALYERVLADPDALVDLDIDENCEELGLAESFAAVADEVYEQLTGREIWDDGADILEPAEAPRGEPLAKNDEGAYRARYPRLASRYLP